MEIEILDQAEDDLIEGFHFYEAQQQGLGSYFLVNLYSDIGSLQRHGGFTARLTRIITGFCRGDFHSRFSTNLWAKPSSFMRS